MSPLLANMEYRRLGQSDLKISSLSFGCMSLGNEFDVNKIIIHQAIELGINFFDTADLYQHGMNEIHVGQALKDKRKSIYIATKVGNQWRPDGKSWDWNPSKDYIIKSVEKSLIRLKTNYIDLYQLHGGTINDPIDETIEAFEILMAQGKIRHYGISSIRPNVIREYLKKSNIVSVMMQHSLLDRRAEENCLDLILEHGKSVIVRGALAKGLLIDKSLKDYLAYNAEEISTIQQKLNASKSWVSPLQAAFQYCLSHPVVSTVVCGIRNELQLTKAVNFSQVFPKLNSKDLDYLKSISKAETYRQHS